MQVHHHSRGNHYAHLAGTAANMVYHHGGKAVKAGRKIADWYNDRNKRLHDKPHSTGNKRRKLTVSDAKASRNATMHGGVEKVYKKIVLYKQPKAKLLPGKWKVKWDYFGTTACNSGRQSAQTMFFLGTDSQMTTGSNSYSIQGAPVALFDMNPYKSTTSIAMPGGTIAQPNLQKLYIKNWMVKLIFSNWGNTECDCELHVFKAKKLANLGAVGTINLTLNDPFNMWNAGLRDAGQGQSVLTQRRLATPAVRGYENNSVLYSRPNHSESLKKYWQTVHLEEFRLTSGQGTRDLTLSIDANKIYSKDEILQYENTAGASTCLPGGLCFLLVARGAAVGKTAADGSAATCPVEVGYVAEIVCTQYALQENLTVSRFSTTVQTQYADATNVSLINDNDTVVNDVRV